MNPLIKLIKLGVFVLVVLLLQAQAQAGQEDSQAAVMAPAEVKIERTAPASVATPVTTPVATPMTTAVTTVVTTPITTPIVEVPGTRSVAFDPFNYTIGPDDALEISVMRHPEFSGVYPINQDGKLQYKFVGDIDVNGMTKQQLEQKLKEALSVYVIAPEVSVTVTEYRSKHFYVLGEVTAPGKYYMRSEAITVREALFEAGLPTVSAAMRKCQLITPDLKGRPRIRHVDVYSILYGGNLKKNVNMKPGDVLYVPSTVMAKVIRVINPVTSAVGLAASGPDNAATGRTAVQTLQGRPTVP